MINYIKEHVQTRDKLPELIKTFNLKFLAEVGVREGHHLRCMMQAEPKHIVAVDIWNDDEELPHNDLSLTATPHINYRNILDLQFNNPSLTAIRMHSVQAAQMFADNYFDLIYIDADHRYNACVEDIKAWWPKTNTVLCGHDWLFSGVAQAVIEFVQANNLKPNFCHFSDLPNDNWFIVK